MGFNLAFKELMLYTAALYHSDDCSEMVCIQFVELVVENVYGYIGVFTICF
jgi:hypothetical protein